MIKEITENGYFHVKREISDWILAICSIWRRIQDNSTMRYSLLGNNSSKSAFRRYDKFDVYSRETDFLSAPGWLFLTWLKSRVRKSFNFREQTIEAFRNSTKTSLLQWIACSTIAIEPKLIFFHPWAAALPTMWASFSSSFWPDRRVDGWTSHCFLR